MSWYDEIQSMEIAKDPKTGEQYVLVVLESGFPVEIRKSLYDKHSVDVWLDDQFSTITLRGLKRYLIDGFAIRSKVAIEINKLARSVML